MTGIQTKKRLRDILVMVAIAVLLIGSLGAPVTARNRGGGGFTNLNASVRVSTKNHAYNVENGILGIDVSKWQGNINWSRVAQDPVSFAFVRADYGAEGDPYFEVNMKGAHDNGILAGVYHYARFKTRAEMQQEAKFFVNQLSKVTVTYPVALDLEHTSHGLSKADLSALAKEFMDIVAAEGYTVLLYTYSNYIGKYLDISKTGNYGLWLANYVERPSTSHKIWQYTNTGKVSGINGYVDVNVTTENLATRGGGGGGVQVDKSTSTTIRRMINERYDSSLSLETLNMDEVNHELARAFQTEVNTQLGGNLEVNGALDRSVAESLSTVGFTLNETSGRITCLVQSKLFYKGYYTESISGVYDDHTVAAIRAYQTAVGLESTGQLDVNTWAALLGIEA